MVTPMYALHQDKSRGYSEVTTATGDNLVGLQIFPKDMLMISGKCCPRLPGGLNYALGRVKVTPYNRRGAFFFSDRRSLAEQMTEASYVLNYRRHPIVTAKTT